jgi:hypothetical protein
MSINEPEPVELYQQKLSILQRIQTLLMGWDLTLERYADSPHWTVSKPPSYPDEITYSTGYRQTLLGED